MLYDYQVSSNKKKRFIKRIYITLVGIAVIFILVLFAIQIDLYIQEKNNPTEQTTTSKSTSYFAKKTDIFTTKYFQFQAYDNWTAVTSETTDNKYVYRSFNKNIIEQELVIYVNELPSDISITRILPVDVINDSELEPAEISDHCNGAVGGPKVDEALVKFQKVSFLCDVDNTQYNLAIGVIGGSTQIKLTRPDKSEANYLIYYKNLKAVPDASQLPEIISSFQPR